MCGSPSLLELSVLEVSPEQDQPTRPVVTDSESQMPQEPDKGWVCDARGSGMMGKRGSGEQKPHGCLPASLLLLAARDKLPMTF